MRQLRSGGLSLSRQVQYCRSAGLMNMQCLIAMGKLQARLARLIWLINGHNESNYQLLTALNCGTLSKVSRLQPAGCNLAIAKFTIVRHKSERENYMVGRQGRSQSNSPGLPIRLSLTYRLIASLVCLAGTHI